MAAEVVAEEGVAVQPVAMAAVSTTVESPEKLLSAYIGVSFAVFLGLLPRAAISHLPSLQARNRALSLKLIQAEEQIRQMRSRRQEDSKANARVVEIFASHRNAWQQEENRLLAQIESATEEIEALRKKMAEMEAAEAKLRADVNRLRKDVCDRDEVIDFMSRKVEDECGDEDFAEKEVEIGAYGNEIGGDYGRGFDESRANYHGEFSTVGKSRISEARNPVPDVFLYDKCASFEEAAALYSEHHGFSSDFLSSKAWTEGSNSYQDFQYESMGSIYPPKDNPKTFIARRYSPWKVDSESTGVSAKLKQLERELLNLEQLSGGETSRIPSSMKKQAKRYHSLAAKIDDLCRRMQERDPGESTLGLEFRTQRQTEFLLEVFHLQQRAAETRQKLAAVQAESGRVSAGEEMSAQAKVGMRKSMDWIRTNLKEIQRSLEVWLARIMGDLEGILARNGVSRVKDYCIPRFPIV